MRNSRYKVQGFSLTEDHLKVIDTWAKSTDLNQSEALRLAIEHLAGHKLIKEGFRHRFVKSSTGE